MPSSKFEIDTRRKTYVRLVGEISHQLNTALHEEHERRGLTRTHMAEILNTNKSFITRKLDGRSNMTLETLADIAFALDRVVHVQLISRMPPPGSNHPPPSSSIIQSTATGSTGPTTRFTTGRELERA